MLHIDWPPTPVIITCVGGGVKKLCWVQCGIGEIPELFRTQNNQRTESYTAEEYEEVAKFCVKHGGVAVGLREGALPLVATRRLA